MVDLGTLVLVTTVIGACELLVLVVLARLVRVYRGPLLWALGLVLIVGGNLLNILRLVEPTAAPAAVAAAAALTAGMACNELGFERFLGLPERRALLATLVVAAAVLAGLGEWLTDGPTAYQVTQTVLFLALSVRVARILLHPATLPFRSSARFLSGGFWMLAGFMAFRLLAIALGAPVRVSPDRPADVVGLTQLVVLAATIVLTFGFVLIAHQRLAEDLRAKERLLDEANGTLERRVEERTAQLAAANQEMAAFTYSMSHDLRAPLRGINGFATLLARRHAEQLDEQGQGYLHRIVSTTEQMGVLIEELLDYARLGQAPVANEPVALQALVASVRDTFEGRIAELGATIDVTEPLPPVMGDAVLISRILTNLVDNALTYVAPGGAAHVRIAASLDAGMVTLRVSDDGIGIPSDQQERVFEVFTRLQTQDAYPGTGIGLSVVRKAARLMGGDVSLCSTVGEGSTFRLALPAA